MSEPIRVDIWSDIACPWCYIGKRRLEAGVAAFDSRPASPPVEIEYHSFQLSPETPVDFEGSEIDFLVAHKRLSEPQVKVMIDRVSDVARTVGLEYDFDALRHTNTVKAHQLLHYAKAHGMQFEAKERLLRAYFIEGRHVGRSDDLADLGTEIGLDRSDVLRSLADNEYLSAVRADQKRAVDYGISSVPFHVIDGRLGLSGAHPAEAFADALAQAAAARAEAVA